MSIGIVAATLALALGSLAEGSEAQAGVHRAVREVMEAHEGRALFTEVYNREGLPAAERDYAARLYEVFFALPGHLAAEQRARGAAPSSAQIADNFGLSAEAVALLLEIAVSDPRLPALLTLDGESGEIASLDLPALEAFAARKGDSVRVAGWSGQRLPDFELAALDGAPLRSADLVGRPALVFLWLTRCPVCRRVTPEVVALAERYASRGLQVVGLCADDVLGLGVPAEERRAWLGEQGVDYRNAVLDTTTRSALGNQNIFPAFFLVSSEGVVERLVINEQPPGVLPALLEPLLD